MRLLRLGRRRPLIAIPMSIGIVVAAFWGCQPHADERQLARNAVDGKDQRNPATRPTDADSMAEEDARRTPQARPAREQPQPNPIQAHPRQPVDQPRRVR